MDSGIGGSKLPFDWSAGIGKVSTVGSRADRAIEVPTEFRVVLGESPDGLTQRAGDRRTGALGCGASAAIASP